MHASELASLLPEKPPIDPRSVVMMDWGGRIDRRVLDQARSLIQEGFSVTVIGGPVPEGSTHSDEDSYPDVPIHRVNYLEEKPDFDPMQPWIPEPLRLDWSELFRSHNHFLNAALAHPAAIYTGHDLAQLPAAVIAAARYGAYVVYDSHELQPDMPTYTLEKKKVTQQAEERLLAFTDQVITVNQSAADVIAARYRVTPPEVILNCPAVSDLPIPRTDRLRDYFDLAEDQQILLFQGSFTMGRNLHKLVEAMAEVTRDDVVLVLLGYGGLEQGLRSRARDLGLLDRRVFFHPKVAQHELMAYSAAADAGIISYPHAELNTYFCTPNKLFEFIVAGLPILANASPELHRFVTGHSIGQNHSMRSATDIAQAIDTFFASSDRARWRANCEVLSDRFVWKAEAPKLVAIYERIFRYVPLAQHWPLLAQGRAALQRNDFRAAQDIAEACQAHRPDWKAAVQLGRAAARAQVQHRQTERSQAQQNQAQQNQADPSTRRKRRQLSSVTRRHLV